jgi:hypothetical protein
MFYVEQGMENQINVETWKHFYNPLLLVLHSDFQIKHTVQRSKQNLGITIKWVTACVVYVQRRIVSLSTVVV